RLAGLPPTRAFFMTWFDPLLAPGKNTFENDVLRQAGVESITADIEEFYPRYGLEQILARDPEAILTVEHNARSVADLKRIAGWNRLTAVRNGRVYVLSEVIQHPSPRFVDGVEELARKLLAVPYVLGVSTGASLGTILYSIFVTASRSSDASGSFLYGRPLAAFLGAACTIAAVYVIGGNPRAGETSQRLLLAGIVFASFLSSINVFLLTSTNQADLRGIFYWLIGDLSRPVDASIYVVAVAVFAGFALLYACSHGL